MLKFGTGLALVCLQFYLLIGLSARIYTALTLPSTPNHYFYKAFQKVPSAQATANKFVKNFLHFSRPRVSFGWGLYYYILDEDIVAVLDGSVSIGSCEFEKGKTALRYLMMFAKESNPRIDTQYAAVTFASSATVNFKFLKYTAAAANIMTIRYPGGLTNTQAGLNEALKLFVNTGSGVRHYGRKVVLLVTDGQSTLNHRWTIPKATALKRRNVSIYVIAVGGQFISGIAEMVRVASSPPENHLFRVSNMDGLLKVIKLVVKQVAPGEYKIITRKPYKPCSYYG